MEQSTLQHVVRKNLIALRRNTGWTRARFAREAGLDGERYREMELGKAAVLLSDLDLMMEHMSIDPVELFQGHPKVDRLSPTNDLPRKHYHIEQTKEDHELVTECPSERKRFPFAIVAGGKTSTKENRERGSGQKPFLQIIRGNKKTN